MMMSAPTLVATDPLVGVTAGSNQGAPESRSGDLSAPRRDRVLRAVRLLAGFGALRRDQLEALLLGDEQLAVASRRVLAYRVVAELRDRALVEQLVVPGSADQAVRASVLTTTGQRVYAGLDPSYPRRGRPVSVVMLSHAVALADIAIAFRAGALRGGDVSLVWESDWEAVAHVRSKTAIPDALVTIERAGWRTRAFIEADRSTEWQRAFAEKVRRYVDLYLRDEWRASISTWPLVLTVTTSPTHARSLARVAHGVAAPSGAARIARAFRVTTMDELRTRGPFAPIWVVGERADRTEILAEDTTATAPAAVGA